MKITTYQARPWLCKVQLYNTKTSETLYCAHAAVWAKDKEEAKKILINTTQGLNEKITKVMGVIAFDETTEVEHQLLAKKVNPSVIVALGKRELLTDQQNISEGADYLSITEHKIPPLPEQKGVPFWDKEWIVPKLKTLLFDQPDSGQKFNTFLVVDATLRKEITGYFDLDRKDIPIRCLFTGKAAKELEEIAPYLVDLSLSDDALINNDKVHEFHKDFFVNHWRLGTGIIIRTTANMDELHHHLRKFTQYENKQGMRFFFRFWENVCIYDYFSHIKTIPRRTKAFYFLRCHHWISKVITHNKKLSRTYSIEPNIDKLSQVVPESNFQLTSHDEQALMRGVIRAYAYDIQQSILKKHSSALLNAPKHEIESKVFDCIKKMHGYKIYNTIYLERLAEYELLHNKCIENEDHKGELKAILLSDIDQDEKYKKISVILNESVNKKLGTRKQNSPEEI